MWGARRLKRAGDGMDAARQGSLSADFERRAPLVVQVVRQYAPSRGGLEDVVVNLSRQLQSRGYRVRVVTLDRVFTALDRKLPARETIDGIEVVRIPFRGSTRYPIAPEVFRHLKDADLVHVHAIDFFFDALAWGKVLHGKPLVATTHGGFFHTSRYAAIKRIWFNVATRLSALAYRRVIGCSAQDTRLFRKIAGRRTVEIGNGADVAKFHDAGATEPLRRIVTIGRFSSNKRLDRLLDALSQLIVHEPDWRLFIVGVPGEVSETELRAMIAERNLDNYVEVLIGLSNEGIRNTLSGCSLFASASEYEGFGLVAVEAMSAGLMPLLHPNQAYTDLAGSHPEVRLCDFQDAEEAAGTIHAAFLGLARDVAGYRTGAMRAANGYSWDKVAGRYAEIYTEILGTVAPAARVAPAKGVEGNGVAADG